MESIGVRDATISAVGTDGGDGAIDRTEQGSILLGQDDVYRATCCWLLPGQRTPVAAWGSR